MSKVEEKKVAVDKTISVKPIKRENWLPKGHDGEYKYTGCETWLVPQRSSDTGQLNTGLDENKERELEKRMNLEVGTLNRYNRDYWSKYKVKIPKEGKTFYLDNPKDELDVLVLKANSYVANSAMEVLDSPKAMFYLSSVEQEAQVENNREKTERKAIQAYGKLSSEEMLDILRVYNQVNNTKTKITTSHSVDYIETTLYNKLKQDPEEFLRITEDSALRTRILIDKLLEARIFSRSGAKYGITGGDIIGHTLQDTIDYLEDPRNQGMLISLKTKLEEVK